MKNQKLKSKTGRFLFFIFYFLFSKKTGQTIIEAMIAIGVLVVGLLGSITLLSNSLSLNRVVTENYVATYLAAEGIEVVKNMIDSSLTQGLSWNESLPPSGKFEVQFDSPTLLSYQGRFFRFNPDNGLYTYDNGNPTDLRRMTTFQRAVTISVLNDGEEVKVNSVVDWQSRGGSFSANIEDHFYNWKK